jgi:hypothetical protein
MNIAVWDTYVTRTNGVVMHFDILVPHEIKSTEIIFDYGRQYLKAKGQEGQRLNSNECRFCHIEEASAEIRASIETKGYHIIEMEGCN